MPLTVTSIDTGVRLWPRGAGRRKLSMAGTLCLRGKFSGNDVGSRRDNFAFRFGPACRYGRGMTDLHLHPSLREPRSEEHTSELQSLMRISYAVFCLNKKKHQN